MRVTKPTHDFLDLISKAGDAVEIEIQNEIGNPSYKKVYIHVNGQTVFRMCKVDSGKLRIIK